MDRRPPRTLAWRLAVLGLVQLVLLAASVVGVGVLIRHERAPQAHAPPTVTMAPPPPSPEGNDAPPPPDAPPFPADRAPPHADAVRRPPLSPLVTFFVSGLLIVGAGSFLTARWIVRPLDALTRAARALGAGDLAARTGLRRRDELGEVGRAFDDMADRVQALLLSERELLANVSHELRTPLARIRVALDIASEADGQTGRASVAEIAADITEIEALIEDILTTTRLDIAAGRGDASTFALHVEEVAPGTVCARAAERFRVRHPGRRLQVSVADGLPSVRADPALFRRVLDNLLENADKYSPDPALEVGLRAAHSAETDGRVVFEVVDRGLGIPPEDLPRVFTPFFRGERSRSRGTGGVGLGLTLAKRIVEAHGGSIEVTSGGAGAPPNHENVSSGTKVRVTLPAAARAH
jgi:two-component system OmpR family sensor kinase